MNAGRLDIEHPGQHRCDGEPGNGENHQARHDPVGHAQRIEGHLSDLQQYPRNDRVRDDNGIDPSAHEFGREA